MDGRWMIVGSNSILFKKRKRGQYTSVLCRFHFFLQHLKKMSIVSRGHCSIILTATAELSKSSGDICPALVTENPLRIHSGWYPAAAASESIRDSVQWLNINSFASASEASAATTLTGTPETPWRTAGMRNGLRNGGMPVACPVLMS